MNSFFKTHLVLASLLFSHFLFGVADYKLIQDMLGRYPVLSQNGNHTVGGVAEIVANEEGVGFILSPLKSSSKPVGPFRLITEKNETILTRTGNHLVQTAQIQGEKIQVEYDLRDGFISILAKDCPQDDRCSQKFLELGNGKSSGDLISMAAFIEKFKGQYKVSSANGHKPSPEAEIAAVEYDAETKECILTFPLCLPNGCDPGYLFFDCGSTPVYQTHLSDQHENFMILQGLPGQQKRYSWDIQNGNLVFVNYQYVLPSNESIVLEHIATKMND